MKQYKGISEFDQDLKSLNKKINLSEQEEKEVLSQLNAKLDKKDSNQIRGINHWKYYVAMTAAACIILLLALPLFNDQSQNIATNDQFNHTQGTLETNEKDGSIGAASNSIIVNIKNHADFDIYQN